MSALPTPPSGLNGRQRQRDARAALVALWDALEGMTAAEAHDLLTGPASAFLPGLDVRQVLDAVARDHARRCLRGGA